MDFKEVLKTRKSIYEVNLGYNGDKSLIVDLYKNPSLLITGSTGTSKSVLMHEILLEMIMQVKENLKIIPICFNKTELLSYGESSYSYCPLISDVDESINMLKKINNIILERKKLFLENNVDSFKKYVNFKNMSFIIVAIDEAALILEDKRGINEILKIVDGCDDTGVSIIVNTSHVYNDFFEKNYNLSFDTKISFDFSDKEQSTLNNIKNSENLNLRKFLVKKDRNVYQYNIYDFDDKYIDMILD